MMGEAPQLPNLEPAEETLSWTAADGVRLPALRWRPRGEPRAVLVCVHGLGGAASDFRPLGRYFATRGYAVYAVNLRGFGLDPRASWRGHMDRPARWFADFAAFNAWLGGDGHAAPPRFWVGESLGALLVMHFFARKDCRVPARGLVLLSPVPVVDMKMGVFARALMRLLIRIAPRLRLSPDAFVRKQEVARRPAVCRDENHAGAMQAQPHRLERFTLRFYGTVAGLLEACPQTARELSLPILYLHAGNDCFITSETSAAFFELIASPGKERRFYAEAHHLLQFDPLTPRVLGDIEDWLRRRG